MSANAIPAPVKEVLDLFSTNLTDVRFGDVDAQSLTSAASTVESVATEVALLEAQLTEARTKLHEAQDALLQRAQRALAYARVYAEADTALSARLEAIALPRATRRARAEGTSSSGPVSVDAQVETDRRPRGRPRKTPQLVILENVAANAE